MKLQNLVTLVSLVPYVLGFPHLANFPEHRSLAGLSPEEVRAVARTFRDTPGAQPLPPPIDDTSSKLVNDPEHPYIPDQPGDIRGPCPGLNTLASHGYLPRNGVASPGQIITAVQEGFNMGYDLASLATYAGFVVDGNHLTNLMTIGANTTACGELTPGLNIHGNLEGDASSTRGDFYFGDNYSFNETLFNVFEYTANLVGNGLITMEAAGHQRAIRVNDSIARNPTFSFNAPRFWSAYGEATFPVAFFVDNQTPNTTLGLTLDAARSFLEFHMYPDNFYRRQAPYGFQEIIPFFSMIHNIVGLPPGANQGVGNFVPNLEDDGSICYAYHKQVNRTAAIYPDPTPELEEAIKANLVTLYQTLKDPACEQYFPYGQ